ncbi:MAG: hypothetical protein RR232_05925 [Clostridia bacterium]
MSLTDYKKHLVQCPHCGKDVLDHMTECPSCKGELSPGGYKPMSPEKLRSVKRTTNIIGFIIAAIVIVIALLRRYGG